MKKISFINIGKILLFIFSTFFFYLALKENIHILLLGEETSYSQGDILGIIILAIVVNSPIITTTFRLKTPGEIEIINVIFLSVIFTIYGLLRYIILLQIGMKDIIRGETALFIVGTIGFLITTIPFILLIKSYHQKKFDAKYILKKIIVSLLLVFLIFILRMIITLGSINPVAF